MTRGPVSADPGTRVLAWTVFGLAAVYLGMRFGLPYLTVWMGLSEHPAPMPRFAMAIYMATAVVGALVLLASDEERWRAFLAPIVRLFALAPGPGRRRRLAVLAAIPLLAGWIAWRQVAPAPPTPATYRLQHPTIPARYVALENPLHALTGEELEAERERGLVLYQKNCRPCHGPVADGDGPLAQGLRLRPIDLTDRGTLPTLVEPYVFWRLEEGAHGLPPVSTPWNSAMPGWGAELDELDLWRIVLATFRLTGHEPRSMEPRE